ncbi:MAG: hypothetical protein ACFNTB_06470, partial [Prevotella denticola]
SQALGTAFPSGRECRTCRLWMQCQAIVSDYFRSDRGTVSIFATKNTDGNGKEEIIVYDVVFFSAAACFGTGKGGKRQDGKECGTEGGYREGGKSNQQD